MSNLVTKEFSYVTNSGQELKLSKKIVQQYLVGNAQINDEEFLMFYQLCKEYKVNPFIREAYLVKYGSSPASIILDYKVLQQIADAHEQFDGFESGVVVLKDEELIYRRGQIVLSNDTLIGGWCKVYRKDRTHYTEKVCMFNEFAAKKRDGALNSNWSGKPAFMIEKVAKAQALREAFPNSFQANVYTQEEATTFEEDKEDVIDVEVVEQKETESFDIDKDDEFKEFDFTKQ